MMLLTGTSIVIVAIQIVYWIALDRGFRRAQKLSSIQGAEPGIAPGVVIAARNEEQRIPALLEALSRQTLPPSEIVFVDDGSTDGTAAAAQAAAGELLPIRIIRMEDAGGNKKRALTHGIESVSVPVVALTDADCVPEKGWLREIARMHASSEPERVVIGYSPFRKDRGLLNRLARYETFVTGLMTAASAGWGRPYMAVGRSLSYSTATFESVGGFEHISSIRSGDDDLFVQRVARLGAAEVVPLVLPETFVHTDGPETWRQWIRQKRRHVSAGKLYDTRIAVHLALFQLTGVLTWIIPFVLGLPGLILLGVRLGAQFAVVRRAGIQLEETDLLPWFVPLELLYAIYNAVLVPLSLIFVRREW